LLIAALFLCCSTASADRDYSWCQGFIVKALGEFPVNGLSRVNLWLDWNEIVSETAVNNSLNQERYQAGRDQFSRLNEAGDAQRIIETSNEDCAIGRNPGWLWW
jgi:hypothetical protein